MKKGQTSDAVVFRIDEEFKKIELLVVKRKYPPFAGEYAFPGGFIEEKEDPKAAAKRELLEETSLDLPIDIFFPLTVRKRPGRDPRGQTATYPFLVLLQKNSIYDLSIKGLDDAECAEWIDIFDLNSLAFDHGAILCEAVAKFWAFMPHAFFKESSIALIAKEILTEKKIATSGDVLNFKEFIFFGGSFNPWHQGHERCVQLCGEFLNESALVLVPDKNPWKKEASSVVRCKWQGILLLLKEIKNYKNVFLYPGFFGMEDINPTSAWLPQLRVEKKSLLMGDDCFCELVNWKSPEIILNALSRIYVVTRVSPKNLVYIAKEKILAINPKIELLFLNNNPYADLSSSAIRDL